MPTSTSSLVVTIAEAAELLRISQSSVRNAIKRGQLHGVRCGRRLLIPTASIDRMLEAPPLSA